VLVVPIVQDLRHRVDVATGRDSLEEVTDLDLAALGEISEHPMRVGHDGVLVEQDTAGSEVRLQDGGEQCPVSAADVNHEGTEKS
jgi:hypothetical protein